MGVIDKIKAWLVGSFVSNLIRHGLTALGAWLIAQGLPSDLVLSWQDATIQIALQALPILIALWWSLIEKRALKKG